MKYTKNALKKTTTSHIIPVSAEMLATDDVSSAQEVRQITAKKGRVGLGQGCPGDALRAPTCELKMASLTKRAAATAT